MTMNTKTTEWEETIKLTSKDGTAAALSIALIKLLLHQSRTELMRKVVGVVGKKLCTTHIEHDNRCYECTLIFPHNLNHYALIKLAKDEGITLE